MDGVGELLWGWTRAIVLTGAVVGGTLASGGVGGYMLATALGAGKILGIVGAIGGVIAAAATGLALFDPIYNWTLDRKNRKAARAVAAKKSAAQAAPATPPTPQPAATPAIASTPAGSLSNSFPNGAQSPANDTDQMALTNGTTAMKRLTLVRPKA
jgi:hypothetical protein